MARKKTNSWNFPKPWTRAQCRERYILGDPIGLRTLATESGVPKGTLERWCKQDSWTEERRHAQDSLRVKADKKSIEKMSDRISDKVADMQTEHFQDYQSFRRLVMLKVNYLAHKCREDQPFERFEAALESLGSATLNYLSLILDRSIKGERIALGLEYEDYNKAIKVLTSAGFEVEVPENMQDLSEAINRLTQRGEPVEPPPEPIEVNVD